MQNMKKLLLSLLAVAGAWTSAGAVDWVTESVPSTTVARYVLEVHSGYFLMDNKSDAKNTLKSCVSSTDIPTLWKVYEESLYSGSRKQYLFRNTSVLSTNASKSADQTKSISFTDNGNGTYKMYHDRWYGDFYFYGQANNTSLQCDGLTSAGKNKDKSAFKFISETQWTNHWSVDAYEKAVAAYNAKDKTGISYESKAWAAKYLDVDNAAEYQTRICEAGLAANEVDPLTGLIEAWNADPKKFALVKDEAEFTLSGQFTQIDIVRNIPADKWNTICLPFDYTPSGWTIYEVTEEKQVDDAISVTVGPSEDGYIKAGKPYVIKPGSDVDCIIAKDVTLTDASSEGNILPFVGTYSPIMINQGDYYVSTASGDLTFKYLGAGAKVSTLKGFRAYFPAGTGNSNRMVFSIGEDSLTQIFDAISEEQNNTEMYDINGRRVNALKSGIYVVGGKKVIIK